MGREHAAPWRHRRVGVHRGPRRPVVGPGAGEGEVGAQHAAEEAQQRRHGDGVGAGPERGRSAQPQGPGGPGQASKDSPEVYIKGGEGRPACGCSG